MVTGEIMHQWDVFLKPENMPKNGYEIEAVANDSVRDYIYRYYNLVRPHSHNLGLSPNEKDEFYWKTSNGLATKG